MLSIELPNVQVSDTTGDDSSNTAKYMIFHPLLSRLCLVYYFMHIYSQMAFIKNALTIFNYQYLG